MAQGASGGVFPHHDALAKDWPNFALLFGWKVGDCSSQKDKGVECKWKVRPIMAMPVGAGNVPPTKFGHEAGRWIGREYAVCVNEVKSIVQHFGVVPEIDAFAKIENARFPSWWGPGSPLGEDAFMQSWRGKLLWMNPPFDYFDAVLDKIKKDEAHVILILPHWRRRKFFRRALEMAVDTLQFPKETHFFEMEGKRLRGIKWPVWAMLICGHTPKCGKSDLRVSAVECAVLHDGLKSDATIEEVGIETSPPPVGQAKGVVDPFMENPHTNVAFQVSKLGLMLPECGEEDEEPSYLSVKEVRHVAHKIFVAENAKKSGRKVSPVFISQGGGNMDERVESLREALHKDFDGSVLRDDLPPLKNLPDRGPYGYAYIPLKENAVPQRQKPFRLQGDRLEAHKKVTKDWADHFFIERPPKGAPMDWLSVTFVVPRKNKDFPWRGVVDMRGPNSQTRRVNFPLPKIEDLLVNKFFQCWISDKLFINNPSTRRVAT